MSLSRDRLPGDRLDASSAERRSAAETGVRRGAFAMRLRGLVRKEVLQIVRDPSSIAIAFLMPVFLLLLFGYGISLDSYHVPLAVVVDQPSPQTAALVAGFDHSRYFAPVSFLQMSAARDAMRRGQVIGIVWLRGNFSRRLLQGRTAPISVVINGVDANNARIIEGYIEGVWAQWLLSQERSVHGAAAAPLNVEQRVWFNPEVNSRYYLVPGLIAVIMTLIGALLTALVVAREWERGTMEALMVTPVTIREILLGKLIPYFVLGMGGMVLSLAMGTLLFHVPLVGSVWILFGCAALFLLAALGMGLLISTVAKNQFVAGQVALLVTFLPAFLLSGFIFDISSMPAPVRLLTSLIAARYFVAILQTLLLAGNVRAVLLHNAAALAIMSVIFLALVRRMARKRLD